jgi:hypothetical protein
MAPIMAVVAILQKTVACDLHRDGAEALANFHSNHVAQRCPESRAPVETVVLTEAAILGGDESLLDVLRHIPEGDVETANDRETPDQAVCAVQYATTFAGVIRANLDGRRAAGESTGRQPPVEAPDSRYGQGKREHPPLPDCDRARGALVAEGCSEVADAGSYALDDGGHFRERKAVAMGYPGWYSLRYRRFPAGDLAPDPATRSTI